MYYIFTVLQIMFTQSSCIALPGILSYIIIPCRLTTHFKRPYMLSTLYVQQIMSTTDIHSHSCCLSSTLYPEYFFYLIFPMEFVYLIESFPYIQSNLYPVSYMLSSPYIFNFSQRFCLPYIFFPVDIVYVPSQEKIVRQLCVKDIDLRF